MRAVGHTAGGGRGLGGTLGRQGRSVGFGPAGQQQPSLPPSWGAHQAPDPPSPLACLACLASQAGTRSTSPAPCWPTPPATPGTLGSSWAPRASSTRRWRCSRPRRTMPPTPAAATQVRLAGRPGGWVVSGSGSLCLCWCIRGSTEPLPPMSAPHPPRRPALPPQSTPPGSGWMTLHQSELCRIAC